MNISIAEFSRTFYSWILKLVFFTGVTIGWTVVTATVVARLDIAFLPVLILFEALFTLAGMLFFSVVVEKTDVKNLIIGSTFFAILSLVVAAMYYENNFLFILFALIANGIFLGQTIIFLSNFIEEHFTPSEAERTFPIIESSETIGGILAGVFLAFFGLQLLNRDIFIVWIGLLALFLVMLVFLKPVLPLSLERMHRSEHKRSRKGSFDLNSFEKSLNQIKKVPFLQILLAVLVLNWIISIFIEFHFTKAVDDSLILSYHGDEAEHEKMLTHGLGTLHILIHGSALIFEILFANRIIIKLGAFGSFLVHTLLTVLGVITNVVAKGFFSSVLLKHNFVLSGKIQKSAYENTYYAYGDDMQKAMREFFEGVAYPLSCVFGTLIIIGMQFLLIDEHFYQFTQLVIIFLIAGMTFFTYQLRSKYTLLNLENLNSDDKITQMRAVNILVQKGHRRTIEVLIHKFKNSVDFELRKLIAVKLSTIKARRSVCALMDLYECATPEEKTIIVKSIINLMKTIERKPLLKKEVAEILNRRLNDELSMTERARILAALAIISGGGLSKYIHHDNQLIRALAIREMWNFRGKRDDAKMEILNIIKGSDSNEMWTIVFLAGNIHFHIMSKFILDNTESRDPQIRVICLLAAICMHHYEYVDRFGKFLLFGSGKEFKNCLDALDFVPDKIKTHIRGALLPHSYLDELPDSFHARFLAERLEKVISACEFGDEIDYLHYNVSKLIPVFSKIK